MSGIAYPWFLILQLKQEFMQWMPPAGSECLTLCYDCISKCVGPLSNLFGIHELHRAGGPRTWYAFLHMLPLVFVSKVNLPLLTSWKWYLLKDSDLGRMPGMWCTSICLSPTCSLCWILLWALAWFTLAYRYHFSGIVFCQTLPKEASRSKEISYNSGENPSLNKNEWTNHNHLMNYSD